MNRIDEAAEELAMGFDRIGATAPGAAHTFRALLNATVGKGYCAPSARARALLGLALAVAGRCDCCIERQIRMAAATGAPRDEVFANLQRAVLMADGPAMRLGAQALARFDELMDIPPPRPIAVLAPAAERTGRSWRPVHRERGAMAGDYSIDTYGRFSDAVAAAHP